MADDSLISGDITDSGFFGSDGGVGAAALDPAVVEFVDALIVGAPVGRQGLLDVLLGLQRQFGRVSWRVQELVAERFAMSPAQVAGVVSFFPLLSAERSEADDRGRESMRATEDGDLRLVVSPLLDDDTPLLLECAAGAGDPANLASAVAHGAYRALQTVIAAGCPATVIDRVKRSGLQERASGGFPVGLKWAVVAETPAASRVVIGSGADSDPSAVAARVLLENHPHKVIEGIVIAGFAVGAQTGVLYLRSQHECALTRVRAAIEQAVAEGFLGSAICGSSFGFDLTICEDAGALMSGEETALINVIQGRRGVARPRPPFPSVSGLWQRPTLVNSLETLANIPQIVVDDGGRAGRTRIIGLSGCVRRPGVVEVPVGVSVRAVVETIGGGCAQGQLRAVHVGGLGGVTLRQDELDTPLDYAALRSLGGRLGSSGVVVLGERDCPVSRVRDLMAEAAAASCGACLPCRIGLDAALRVLESVEDGSAQSSDVVRLSRLAGHVRRTAMCEHGRNAARTVLASLRAFSDLYDEHVAAACCPISLRSSAD